MIKTILLMMVACPLYAQGNGTPYPKITTDPLLFFLVPAAQLKEQDQKRYHAKMRYIENATPHANVPNIWYVTMPITEHGVPIDGELSQKAPHVKSHALTKTVRTAYHPAPVAQHHATAQNGKSTTAKKPHIKYVRSPITEHGVPIDGELSQKAPHVKSHALPKTVRTAYHPAPVA